jgi:flagellar motor switch protein FliG
MISPTVVTRLTGVQKAAVILASIPKEQAAAVLRQMSEEDRVQIGKALATLPDLNADITESVISEVQVALHQGKVSTTGGRSRASELMAAAFGTDEGSSLMDRVDSSIGGHEFEFLENLEPAVVARALESEAVIIIAIVLAKLSADQRAKVLIHVESAHGRGKIVAAIAQLERPSADTVKIVAKRILERFGSTTTSSLRAGTEDVGGVQSVVDMINRSDAATEKGVLAELEEIDPELAEEIRSKLLTFEDILKLADRDIQPVMVAVKERRNIALALKGARQELQERVLGSLSNRLRESIEEEATSLGAVRKQEVDNARSEIVRVMREMLDDGSITMARNDDDQLVE